MTLSDPVARALHRLTVALDQLEAASARRARADEARVDLDDELSVMQDDRARLAVELDAALARARALDEANLEVARRVERAKTALRSILSSVAAGATPPDLA